MAPVHHVAEVLVQPPVRTDAPVVDHKAGVAFVDAILYVYDEAIAAPTIGWLPNDQVFPTIFLDNLENFQLGALEGLRYAVRVLRDDLTRLRTTDEIDPDVELAFNQFSISEDKWLLPPAEGEYAKGADALRSYRARLLEGKAPFYPRADNLTDILDQLNSLLGGTNNRLLNTIPNLSNRLSEETAGDTSLSGEEVVHGAMVVVRRIPPADQGRNVVASAGPAPGRDGCAGADESGAVPPRSDPGSCV